MSEHARRPGGPRARRRGAGRARSPGGGGHARVRGRRRAPGGCPACLEELARLRRADALLRPILAAEPDPALRERTLGLVRAVGVTRGAGRAVRVTAAPLGATRSPAAARRAGGGPPALHDPGLDRRGRGRPRDRRRRREPARRSPGRRPGTRTPRPPSRRSRARRRRSSRPATPARSSLAGRQRRGGGTLVLSPSAEPDRRDAAGLPAPRPAPSTAAGSRSTGSGRARGRCGGPATSPGGAATWPSRRTCRRGSPTAVSLVDGGRAGAGTVVLAGELYGRSRPRSRRPAGSVGPGRLGRRPRDRRLVLDLRDRAPGARNATMPTPASRSARNHQRYSVFMRPGVSHAARTPRRRLGGPLHCRR